MAGIYPNGRPLGETPRRAGAERWIAKLWSEGISQATDGAIRTSVSDRPNAWMHAVEDGLFFYEFELMLAARFATLVLILFHHIDVICPNAGAYVGSAIAMTNRIYIDGTLYDREDAKISVFDHGLLYGDGVFEGIRCYAGKPFQLARHLDRLWDSAKSILLRIPLTREEMAEAVVATLAANNIRDGYVRLLVTRGTEVSPALTPGVTMTPDGNAPSLDSAPTSSPSVIIIADKIALYPHELYEHGIAICTAETIQNHPSALNPRVKSLNYLGNVMAKLEGEKAGVIEALMLNYRGEVAECTADNIFIVRDGILRTPPLTAGILEGVTRDVILELAAEAKIRAEEVPLRVEDIYEAAECFLTGTAAEVIPVIKIDGKIIGSGTPGPVTKMLSERYHTLTRS